jgi:hypothetical protein
MGLYLRKSLSVGPLRFNLSKSGVGVSSGIKGLRLGSGPRGNYVHMGRHGLYFRKSLAPGRAEARPVPPAVVEPCSREPDIAEPLEEIESGNVLKLFDSSAVDFLEELNSKRKLVRFFPLTAIVSIAALACLVFSGAPNWLSATTVVLAVVVTALVYVKDLLRKTVVVFYDLEPDVQTAYQGLHDAFDALRRCAGVWHVEAAGRVRQSKYHAGANTLVQRTGIALSKGNVPYLKTNIDVPTIPVGKQLLAFMPDRLLVFDSGAVGAVPYVDLDIQTSQTHFVEDGTVPRDSRVVDQTWKYVNKKGGPDRRFKDNREIPVVLYEEIRFSSTSGINELVQVSRTGVGESFKSAVLVMAGE